LTPFVGLFDLNAGPETEESISDDGNSYPKVVMGLSETMTISQSHFQNDRKSIELPKSRVGFGIVAPRSVSAGESLARSIETVRPEALWG